MAYFARKGSEAQRFLSPAEQLRENKAKMKVKAYIQKFFNLAAMKRLQVYFWIWYSRVEVQREEAKIFNTGYGAVSNLIEFNNRLKDEKNRAKSKILLDGFASLNQNVLKEEESDEEMNAMRDAETGDGDADDVAGMQQFLHLEIDKNVKKNKQFKHIFSIYR